MAIIADMADVGSSVNGKPFLKKKRELFGVTLTPLFCFLDTEKQLGSKRARQRAKGKRQKAKGKGKATKNVYTTWVGWDVVENMLLFGPCCLLLVGGSLLLGSLPRLPQPRVLLGLAVLHVVGGVEEEDRAW